MFIFTITLWKSELKYDFLDCYAKSWDDWDILLCHDIVIRTLTLLLLHQSSLLATRCSWTSWYLHSHLTKMNKSFF